MKQTLVLLSFILFISCTNHEQQSGNTKSDEVKKSIVVEITDTNNTTPTVHLSTYKLVMDSGTDRRSDARKILKVKRSWPLAMQSQNPSAFDAILSRNFTFHAPDTLYNRYDYIKDRTRPTDWAITFVKYENVTLQFLGDTGILSYVNHITNKNLKTGNIEYEHITWVDVYVLEEGSWKIGTAHVIDYRLDLPAK